MTGYIGLYVMTFLLVKFSIQQQITVTTGSSVRLSCACAKSSSLHTTVQSPITWTFTSSSGPILIANWTGVQNDVVSYSSTTKYRMVTRNWLKGDLNIYDTSPADQGNYTCEITRRCRPTVLLDINVPVSKVFITINNGPFLKAGDIVTIAENDRAIFKCYSFGAKPAAKITWSLSRIPIRIQVPSVSFSSHTYKGRYDAVSTLIVKRATLLGYNDQPLTCRGLGASSSMANSSVWLRIVAPLSHPTITGKTNITLSTTHRSVILSCSTINSYPLAIIQWSVGGEDHPSTIHHQERFGRFDVTSHLDLVVDGSDDGLEIVCKVSSPLQTLNKSVTLNVLAPPLRMTVNWTEKPVKEGESLTVLCTAFGANPKPHVYWKTSSHGINDNDVIRDEDTATSLLRLSPVTRTDAGLYSCHADNQIASKSIIRSFTLIIYYEPNIITKLRTMNIPRHEDIFNITCVAEAIPLPVVEWTGPSYITNLSRPITEVFGTTIVSHMQIPDDRGNLLPGAFNVTCSASNIVGRTTWTIEIRYGEVSDDVDEDVDPTAPLTVGLPILCEDKPHGIPKMPVERPLLIALISACFVFLLIVLVWHTRRRLKMDEFWVVRRDGFYVDMTRRRAGIPGISTVDEEAVSNTTSPRLTPSSGASIRFEFVSQQSVENTYDAIPIVSAMPPALQPRRRRVRSDDGYYYDVPPPPRGFDTIRRVQSRRLPTVPTMFIAPETMQAVLRSLSRDTGEMERPTLEHQPGGRSETIIREEVRLFKKSQLRRVLSL